MKQFFGKLLKNNNGLKLLSFVLAFILWITIINVIDPSDTTVFTGINVNVLNTEVLTEQGYIHEIVEGNVISITVTGPKTVLDSLSASDFYATADLAAINPTDTYVPINVVCTKSGVASAGLKITPRTERIKVSISNRETRTVDVELKLVGEPESGYTVGDTSISPTSIKLTGASETLDQVASAVAEYDVEGATMDIADTISIHLYDEDGMEINTSGITLSRDAIRVKIPILILKTVPVNFVTSGALKEGYRVSSIESTINEVTVAGTVTSLSSLSSVDVPADAIDVTDLDADTTYSIRLSHYLPSSVKIMSEVLAEVTVHVEEVTEVVLELPTTNITIENASKDCSYAFTRDSISITFKGLKEDIDNISVSNIKASVDVQSVSTNGTRTFTLDVENIGECTPVGEYAVGVTVTRR